MKKNVAIYVRSKSHSTFAQTLEIQRCAALAATHGNVVDRIYTDVESDTDEGVDAYRDLVSECATENIDTIYALSRDRFIHPAAGAEHMIPVLQKCGVTIHFLSDAIGMTAEQL